MKPPSFDYVRPGTTEEVVATLADDRWLAINTVVEEKRVTELFPQLSEAGARGIVEYPHNKIIE